MDADIISYETLLATRDSANWVMLGAIATGVAALGSLLTLYYAVAALNTWKKQEKTKIRSEFKRSLLALDYAIHMMPDGWDSNMARVVEMKSVAPIYSDSLEAELKLGELKKCWHDAISAWVMCEGLLTKTKLTVLWGELSDIYVRYTKGYVNKKKILDKLAEMHSIEFIFEGPEFKFLK